MSGDIRPNFQLSENSNQRCATCGKAAYDANNAAYCMLEASGDAANGKRVNENFVCDVFVAK
jgi:hypothetical protein